MDARTGAKVAVPDDNLAPETTSVPSTLMTAVEWAQTHEHTILETVSIEVSSEDLEGKSSHVYYFSSNGARDGEGGVGQAAAEPTGRLWARPVRRSGTRRVAAPARWRRRVGDRPQPGCGGGSDGRRVRGGAPNFTHVSFGIQIALVSAWRSSIVLHYEEQLDKGGRTTMAAGTDQHRSEPLPSRPRLANRAGTTRLVRQGRGGSAW